MVGRRSSLGFLSTSSGEARVGDLLVEGLIFEVSCQRVEPVDQTSPILCTIVEATARSRYHWPSSCEQESYAAWYASSWVIYCSCCVGPASETA